MLLIQRDLLRRFAPDLLNQFRMLWRADADIALKRLRDTHPSRNHLANRIDRLAIYHLFGDVETPNDSADVQVQRFLCNMNSGTYSPPSSVREVVALVWIGNVQVRRRG